MTPPADELLAIRELLIPSYVDYCQRVNSRGMALSIETGTFLYWACRDRDVRSAADLGSGWSSYVLRLYAAESGHTEVISVDDDAAWLERTAEFLHHHDMPADGLMTWEEFLAAPTSHDLICHDLAGGELRESAMAIAATRVRKGGVIVFDDAQHDSHRAKMLETIADFGMSSIDAHDLTLDMIGRYAMAAVA